MAHRARDRAVRRLDDRRPVQQLFGNMVGVAKMQLALDLAELVKQGYVRVARDQRDKARYYPTEKRP